MLCVSEVTPDSGTGKAMVESSTPMATVNQVQLYSDTCNSHMSTTFKENFVTLNEDQTSGNLNGIASGITIRGTSTVKYVILENTGKPHTIVEAYWVPELKHGLVSPQDIHTKERNPMSFQNQSTFEGEERFSGLMVNTKLKGYRGQSDLQTTKIQ